jgi:hypothetical protein
LSLSILPETQAVTIDARWVESLSSPTTVPEPASPEATASATETKVAGYYYVPECAYSYYYDIYGNYVYQYVCY